MNDKYDRLYHIAETQAGYFTAGQAREVGFSYERLSSNASKGRFQRVDHGIYRWNHYPYSPFEDLFTAWLRTGPDSVISHQSALSVFDLSDYLPDQIHVIVPRTASRRRENLCLHTNQISEDEITTREGLPVTTPARTIADVANANLSREFVIQALEEALQRGLTTENDLREQAKRRGGRAKELIQSYLENRG